MLPMASTGDLLGEMFGQVGALHPRFHGPAVGQRPVPEDAEVNLVGCFAESQFGEADLKYYGSANGASFGPMFWHAHDDHAPYIAMARHDDPLGHGFTFRSFAHEKEKPKWGVYDGCGAPCEDDEARYCGCAGEGSRGFSSQECEEGEKRFAVYRIGLPNGTAGDAAVPSLNASNATEGANATAAAGANASAAVHGRAHWRLSEESGDAEKPSIEIVLPAGGDQIVLQSKGHAAMMFDASDTSAVGTAVPAPAKAAPPSEAGADATSTAVPTAAKVKLPMGVAPDSCTFQAPKDGAGGAQRVLKCKVDDSEVRKIPIKVIDEL